MEIPSRFFYVFKIFFDNLNFYYIFYLFKTTNFFFQLLKRERICRQIYQTRDQARADVFNYIEMFYNPTRRHSSAAGLSPAQFERRYFQQIESV